MKKKTIVILVIIFIIVGGVGMKIAKEQLYGSMLSQSQVTKMYQENKSIINDIANYINSYPKAEGTFFYISPTKGTTIRGAHGAESGYEFSEEFERNVQQLFSNSQFVLIYDSGKGSPIVLETKVNHSFTFNGVVLTNDNEEPMYGFIKEPICQEIEKNVYYFEGQ